VNWALAAAAATGVQVGASIVASRYVAPGVAPATLAMLRYAIGLMCLLPFCIGPIKTFIAPNMSAPAPRLRKVDIASMAALGVGQFGILIALLNWSLHHIDATRASMVFSLFPLITLGLSTLLAREPFRWAVAVGVVLSIAGVAAALGPKALSLQGTNWLGNWLGELGVLASASVGALCSVLYRPYLKRYPTLPVCAWAMLASVVFLAVLAWPEDWVHRITEFKALTWTVVTGIGISSGLGYVAWLYALKHESPTRVTVFLALNPVTAAWLGHLWLGEPFNNGVFAGLVLITAGLWLATRANPASRPPHTTA
jgi:drug/metabolite transporter (DMT)-like permease